ncbi:MAG: hypothetical protein HZA36_02030 [Parcubacteria group bacterium]|nr:hypothetical protein [Parcubacteria group bacterium]
MHEQMKRWQNPQSLISTQLFNVLAQGLMKRWAEKEKTLSLHQAQRRVCECVSFLQVKALFPNDGLSPSQEVDEVWHLFLTYSREYEEFCTRLAGAFIHHIPDDAPDGGGLRRGVGATAQFMQVYGIPFYVPYILY